MGHRLSRRGIALTATMVMLWAAVPAHGALPLIAGLGKQLVQNLLIDGVKSQLMGSLSDMGCKGAALASVLSGGKAGIAGMLGGALMPGLPSGLTMPAGMAMPPGMAMPSGAMPGLGDPKSMGMDSSPMMALMQQQLGARAGAMPTMAPEQMAQLNASMAAMQQAMSQPLSRAETLTVFDELAELGVMTPAMQSEARDCITLAPPAASATLGMTGAMMKNMVLPQLRSAREEMANLAPEEREQLATEIAQAMKDLPPEDRKAFQEGFGAGFFPPEVVTAVKDKLR